MLLKGAILCLIMFSSKGCLRSCLPPPTHLWCTKRGCCCWTIFPLRALALYGKMKRDAFVLEAARRCAEVFLQRQIFRRISTGEIIDPDYLVIRYPYYVHYDILFALKLMAEAGYIRDPRGAAAVDLLQAKRLPDGGFPNEKRWFTVSNQTITRGSYVDWGPVSKSLTNEYITVDAYHVLRAAGRC